MRANICVDVGYCDADAQHVLNIEIPIKQKEKEKKQIIIIITK